MGQRHYTVDIGEGGERFGVDIPAKVIGHGPGHGRRAIDRSENAYIVAGRDAAIGPHDALEHRFRARRGMGIDAESVVTGKVAHLHIVHMHVIAGFDGLRRKTDDLSITAQGLALLHALAGDFVPGGNRLAHRDRLGFQAQAFGQGLPCNQYVVQGIEANHGRVAGPGSGNQLHGTSQGTADFLL
ncbi:hypothetical protein D3C84_826460 [compost metagenome]